MQFGGSLVSNGTLTGGDLMSYLIATQTMQRSLGTFSLSFIFHKQQQQQQQKKKIEEKMKN